jgi:hypothetical protein
VRDIARHGLGSGMAGGLGALALLPGYGALWAANTPFGRSTLNSMGSSAIRNLPVGPYAAWLAGRQVGQPQIAPPSPAPMVAPRPTAPLPVPSYPGSLAPGGWWSR